MKKLSIKLDFSRLRLLAEISLWRHGLLPVISALAVLVCLLVWAVWVPEQLLAVAKQNERLDSQQMRLRDPATRKTVQIPPEILFERVLTPSGNAEEVVRRIFLLAGQTGGSIAQADYRHIAERGTTEGLSIAQLQIALPFKAPYPNVRRFMLNLLSEFPAMSIDQINLKRESASQAEVDAQMILTVWERADMGPRMPARERSQ